MLQVTGPIPDGFASVVSIVDFIAGGNELSGSLPDAIVWPSRMKWLELDANKLSGCAPNALHSTVGLIKLSLAANFMKGCLPDALSSLQALVHLHLQQNSFTGSASHAMPAVVRYKRLFDFKASQNELQGALPKDMPLLATQFRLALSHNQLQGTVPSAPHFLASINELFLTNNLLSGSIPQGCHNLGLCDLHHNRLTGSVPVDLLSSKLWALRCSENAIEGQLPLFVQPLKLQFLGISGIAGGSAHLRGPLPASLQRASLLKLLLAHDHMLEDGVPGLSSTLNMLALHRNSLTVLPELRFVDEVHAPDLEVP